MEVQRADKTAAQNYAKTYDPSKKIKFSYDTSGTVNNSSMWNYMYSVGYRKRGESITLPVVVYIDANNKLQYIESGSGITADKILSHVKEIEAATGTSRSSNTGGNTGNNGNANNGGNNNNSNSGQLVTASGLKLLNLPNIDKAEYTLLSGGKVNNVANGRTKVLLFFQTTCLPCKYLTRSIANSYSRFSGIDFYEVEVSNATVPEIQYYAKTYDPSGKIKFAYGDRNLEAKPLFNYLYSIGETKAGTPTIVYIDANNRLQYLEADGRITADIILAHVKEIEDAVKKYGSTNPGSGNTNNNTGNNTNNGNSNGNTNNGGSTVNGNGSNSGGNSSGNNNSNGNSGNNNNGRNSNNGNGSNSGGNSNGGTNSAQKLNSKGLPYDPDAVVDPSKNGVVMDGFYVFFNTKFSYAYFRDAETHMKNYGTYDYKEQYWIGHNLEIDTAEIHLEKLYKKIDLSKTTLGRDEKGKCVGAVCYVTVPNNGNTNNGGNNQNTNPGQTSASSGLKLMNASNAAKTDFYMLDGTVSNNYASGRSKVLIFFETTCSPCVNITKNLSSSYDRLNGIDIIEVEMNKGFISEVRKYASDNDPSKKIKFAFDATGVKHHNLMWSYVSMAKLGSTVALPIVVYIDANNKVQYVESDSTLTADKLLSRVNEIEAATGTRRSSSAGAQNQGGQPFVNNSGKLLTESRLELLNTANFSKTAYYLLEGSTVTNFANGKMKILLFIDPASSTTSGVSAALVRSLGYIIDDYKGIDIYVIPTDRARKNLMEQYAKDNDSSKKIKFAYGASDTLYASSFEKYRKMVPANLSVSHEPLAVYIDANNKIQYVECCGGYGADKVLLLAKEIEAAVKSSSSQGGNTGNSGNTNGNTGNGNTNNTNNGNGGAAQAVYRNSIGLPYDPTAVVNTKMNGETFGGFKLVFNTSSGLIYFRNPKDNKITYGTYNYKDQYWVDYNAKIVDADLPLEKLYTRIDLSKTTLSRDKKGNCVGRTCEVTPPGAGTNPNNGSGSNSSGGTPQAQFLNSKGLPYDPNATYNARKTYEDLDGFYVFFNTVYPYAYFRDKTTKQINYGTYDMKEQYWIAHNKEIDNADIHLEKLFTKIDLSKTTLGRDEKGNCVGSSCTVTK